jgi:hypothetical protein
MKRTTIVRMAVVAGLVLARPAVAGADEAASPNTPATAQPVDEAKRTEARRLFGEGVEHVKKFQWAEALGAFEKSHALVPNANTSLNIGVCERALGRYVRARQSLRRALDESEAGGGVLSPTSLADAEAYLEQIDGVVVRARLTVKPSDAALSIDGRPLAKISAGERTVFAAGIAPAGPGARVPAEAFEVVLDPGNHVFVLARSGFSDAVVNRTLAPGSSTDLVLELEKLPATLKVSSSIEGAIVQVAEVDVGPVPVDVLRPAGRYPVIVRKEGYVPYETSLTVRPGEEAIDAVLAPESLNVAEQWWFWTSIVGGLGTAAVVTYFVVRPEPDPPPYDGGSSGWVVQPSAIRF